MPPEQGEQCVTTNDQTEQQTQWQAAESGERPEPRRYQYPFGGLGQLVTDLSAEHSIIIEWPAMTDDTRALPGRLTAIRDADTEQMIETVSAARIVVDASATGIVTADLTMYADQDGNPRLGGQPNVGDDGEIATGVFRFAVAAMRVSGQQ